MPVVDAQKFPPDTGPQGGIFPHSPNRFKHSGHLDSPGYWNLGSPERPSSAEYHVNALGLPWSCGEYRLDVVLPARFARTGVTAMGSCTGSRWLDRCGIRGDVGDGGDCAFRIDCLSCARRCQARAQGARVGWEHPLPNGGSMKHGLDQSDDLVWLLRHTRGFRGGYIAEFHVERRYLFDENRRCDVVTGTTVSMLIRYSVDMNRNGRMEPIQRLARMHYFGVTDFSFFEQEGAHSGSIVALQVEIHLGKFRFWFDQYGEVYVVCEQAELEEVATPGRLLAEDTVEEWVFQAQAGTLPTVSWLLAQLDRAGLPCVWREEHASSPGTNPLHWTGLLELSAVDGTRPAGAISIQGYGELDGHAFGLAAMTRTYDRGSDALLRSLGGIVTGHFVGDLVESKRGAARSLRSQVGTKQGNEGLV